MRTSDVAPLQSLKDVVKIATSLKDGEFPRVFLPIDAHIMERSTLMELVEQVPNELQLAKAEERKPYLPIRPKSLRKEWQYDDEAYNFIYDYLGAFTAFNFTEGMQDTLQRSRARVVSENTPEELFEFLTQAATPANFRRFQENELEEIFYKRIAGWGGQITQQRGELEDDGVPEL